MEQNSVDGSRVQLIKIEDIITEAAHISRSEVNIDNDEFVRLKDTIEKSGIIQPIILRRNEEDKIELVAGKRRLIAAQALNMESVPAIFTDKPPRTVSLLENVARMNLTVIERAEAIKELITEMGDIPCSQKEVAGQLGLKESSICDYKRIAEMPMAMRDRLRNNTKCSVNKLVAIARIEDPDGQENAFNEYAAKVEGNRNENNGESVPLRQAKKKIRTFQESFDKQKKRKDKWENQDKNDIKSELLRFKEYIDELIKEIEEIEAQESPETEPEDVANDQSDDKETPSALEDDSETPQSTPESQSDTGSDDGPNTESQGETEEEEEEEEDCEKTEA